MAPYRLFIESHMTDVTLIGWSTNKLKRVVRSSLSAEIQQAFKTDNELFAARLFWSEIKGYQVTKHNVTDAVKATTGIIVLDATGVYDAVQNSSSAALGLTDKRSGIELLGLKDSVEEHDTDPRWYHGDIQLADGMTKRKMSYRILSFLRSPRWKLVLDTTYTSSK